MRTVLGVATLLLVAGCGGETAAKAPVSTSLHVAMVEHVSANAQRIWDVYNKSLDDAGQPEAQRLVEADWQALAAAAVALKADVEVLSGQKVRVTTLPGETIQDEGAPEGRTARDVQAQIDADPQGFAEQATLLGKSADAIHAAVVARNFEALSGQVEGLDGVCEACHQKYWFPER